MQHMSKAPSAAAATSMMTLRLSSDSELASSVGEGSGPARFVDAGVVDGRFRRSASSSTAGHYRFIDMHPYCQVRACCMLKTQCFDVTA